MQMSISPRHGSRQMRFLSDEKATQPEKQAVKRKNHRNKQARPGVTAFPVFLWIQASHLWDCEEK